MLVHAAASRIDVLPAVNTETFHAQYRVLEAFTFFNIILIWAFMLMLLFLAVRHHRWGHKMVWLWSVTAFPWFGGQDMQTGKLGPLPPPASTKRSTSTRSQRPTDGLYEKRPSQREARVERVDRMERTARMDPPQRRPSQQDRQQDRRPNLPEKRPSQSSRHHQRRPSATRRDTPTRNETQTYVYMLPHAPPEPVHLGETARQVRDKYLRDASPRR